jgi:hypothetical protein
VSGERITEAELRHMWLGPPHDRAEDHGERQRIVDEVRRLRGLVEEAARLQAINREREKRGLEIVYNTDIDKEHPDLTGVLT